MLFFCRTLTAPIRRVASTRPATWLRPEDKDGLVHCSSAVQTIRLKVAATGSSWVKSRRRSTPYRFSRNARWWRFLSEVLKEPRSAAPTSLYRIKRSATPVYLRKELGRLVAPYMLPANWLGMKEPSEERHMPGKSTVRKLMEVFKQNDATTL